MSQRFSSWMLRGVRLDTPLTLTSQIIMEQYLRFMLVVGIDWYEPELMLVLISIGVKLFFRLQRKLIDTLTPPMTLTEIINTVASFTVYLPSLMKVLGL